MSGNPDEIRDEVMVEVLMEFMSRGDICITTAVTCAMDLFSRPSHTYNDCGGSHRLLCLRL